MVIKLLYIIQLNVLTTATLGTEQSGHGREATVVEELSSRVNVWIVPPKSGHCREVAVSGSLTVFIQSTAFIVDTQDSALVTLLVRLCNSKSKIQFCWVLATVHIGMKSSMSTRQRLSVSHADLEGEEWVRATPHFCQKKMINLLIKVFY